MGWWVAADEAFGMSPSGRAWMWKNVRLPAWTSAEGNPQSNPGCEYGQRQTLEQRLGDELPDEAWREITMAQGSQGPSKPQPPEGAPTTLAKQLGRLPPEPLANPATTCPMAPEDTSFPWEAPVGQKRSSRQSDVGLDEYETRTWAGWHHHVAMCLLGGAFLLSLQQAWGEKDAPDHEAAGVPGGAGNAAPGTVRANRSIAAVA